MVSKNIYVKLGLLAGALLLFSSFKNKNKSNKKRSAGVPLINQLDAPTGTQQVYSMIGTRLFDKNNNIIKTYDVEGAGMTVTGYENGMYSVVYGDSFQNGLPAYVNQEDVIV